MERERQLQRDESNLQAADGKAEEVEFAMAAADKDDKEALARAQAADRRAESEDGK